MDTYMQQDRKCGTNGYTLNSSYDIKSVLYIQNHKYLLLPLSLKSHETDVAFEFG